MERDSQDKLEASIDRFARRLPDKVGNFVRWITGRSSSLIRIPLGIVLMVGGVIGFLPILGFWMVPLGLVLIAQDIPLLRPPLIRLLGWIERKWPQQGPAR
ncbi:MAG: hypothetical protein ACRECO_20325 [Xanthobacteraceae bacterium]